MGNNETLRYNIYLLIFGIWNKNAIMGLVVDYFVII